MYILRIQYYPAMGKAAELRGVLEERIKMNPPQGVAVGLGRQLVPPDGPVFALSIRFPDMAAYETFMQSLAGDQTFPAFQNKVASLTIRPPKQELFEVLIPLPPAN